MSEIKFWSEFKAYSPMMVMAMLLSFIGAVLGESQQYLYRLFPEIFEISKPLLSGWPFGIVIATFIFGYLTLSLKLKKDTLFYVTFSFFIICTLCFLLCFLFRKQSEFLTFGANHPLKWMSIIFLMMNKLWTIFVFPVLFWGFANDVLNDTKAKLFYTVFLISAMIGSSIVIPFHFFGYLLEVNKGFDPSRIIVLLLTLAIISKFIIIKCYRKQFECFKKDSNFDFDNKGIKKFSLAQHFKIVIKSKALFYIFSLFLCCGISITAIETIWKHYLMKIFSNPERYMSFLGYFYISSVVSTIVMVLVAWYVLNRFDWKRSALTTPVILCVTSLLFFVVAIFPALSETVGLSSIITIVAIGTIHNILAKGLYFALFSPTKEMMYISLTPVEKLQGKAVVDTLAPILGLAMGSIVMMVCLTFVGSIEDSLISLLAIILSIYFIWILSVNSLNRHRKEINV